MNRRAFGGVACALTLSSLYTMQRVRAHESKAESRLPVVGPIPEFALDSSRRRAFTHRDMAGKVGVVTFIFTQCRDACPALTAKLVDIQRRLTRREQRSAGFVAITVDPRNDTPAVLAEYARNVGATDSVWQFLTGSETVIRAVTDGFAVVARKATSGDIEHSFLTSLVDRRGQIRVQYMGVRFSRDEFLQDLRSLLREPSGS